MAFFNEAAAEAKKVPWWGWAGGAVVLLLVARHLMANRATDTTGTTSDGEGIIDPSGDLGIPGPYPGPTGTGTGGTGGSGGSGGKGGGSGSGADPGKTGGGGTTTTSYATYTVKSGDTLYGIASKYHVDEGALYALNKSVIEQTAKSHSFANSDSGHWIFPGEVLKIPK